MNDMPGAYQNRIVTEPQREAVPENCAAANPKNCPQTKKSAPLTKVSGTD
jgi:hypothetical protein